MKPVPLTPAGYAAAARRIVALANRVQATAGAQTVRERQARTRAINLLAQHVKRLQVRNAGLMSVEALPPAVAFDTKAERAEVAAMVSASMQRLL